MMSFIKKCYKCKIEKSSEEFYNRRSGKDGLQAICKLCSAKYRAENKERAKEHHEKWYAENKERVKERNAKWYAENKERCKENAVKWREENKERCKESAAKWREENKERCKESVAKWREGNRERYKEKHKKWRGKNKEKTTKQIMQRYYSDTNFRLAYLLRGRIRTAIKKGCKSAKTMELLGC